MPSSPSAASRSARTAKPSVAPAPKLPEVAVRSPAPESGAAVVKDVGVPVGVRLSAVDREFLEQAWPGQSISDAIRSSLKESRVHRKPVASLEDALARVMEAIGGLPSLRPEGAARSVVVEDLVREAGLMLAEAGFYTASDTMVSHQGREVFEGHLVDSAFDLMEALLRHALSTRAAAWDPEVVRRRLKAARPLLIEILAVTANEHRATSPSPPRRQVQGRAPVAD